LLIKYVKSVLWRATKRLSYIEDARCLKVKYTNIHVHRIGTLFSNEVVAEVTESNNSNLLLILKRAR